LLHEQQQLLAKALSDLVGGVHRLFLSLTLSAPLLRVKLCVSGIAVKPTLVTAALLAHHGSSTSLSCELPVKYTHAPPQLDSSWLQCSRAWESLAA
jgi:hypothetical protein